MIKAVYVQTFPSISISDAGIIEGAQGDTQQLHFIVSLSQACNRMVNVAHGIQDISSNGGSDYAIPSAGAITFFARANQC